MGSSHCHHRAAVVGVPIMAMPDVRTGLSGCKLAVPLEDSTLIAPYEGKIFPRLFTHALLQSWRGKPWCCHEKWT